jgi:hypothetical protein
MGRIFVALAGAIVTCMAFFAVQRHAAQIVNPRTERRYGSRTHRCRGHGCGHAADPDCCCRDAMTRMLTDRRTLRGFFGMLVFAACWMAWG